MTLSLPLELIIPAIIFVAWLARLEASSRTNGKNVSELWRQLNELRDKRER